MEANNDILADKPIETHIEKSILNEPDPPDKEMDGIDSWRIRRHRMIELKICADTATLPVS
jgi:hypothetical protein